MHCFPPPITEPPGSCDFQLFTRHHPVTLRTRHESRLSAYHMLIPRLFLLFWTPEINSIFVFNPMKLREHRSYGAVITSSCTCDTCEPFPKRTSQQMLVRRPQRGQGQLKSTRPKDGVEFPRRAASQHCQCKSWLTAAHCLLLGSTTYE